MLCHFIMRKLPFLIECSVYQQWVCIVCMKTENYWIKMYNFFSIPCSQLPPELYTVSYVVHLQVIVCFVCLIGGPSPSLEAGSIKVKDTCPRLVVELRNLEGRLGLIKLLSERSVDNTLVRIFLKILVDQPDQLIRSGHQVNRNLFSRFFFKLTKY